MRSYHFKFCLAVLGLPFLLAACPMSPSKACKRGIELSCKRSEKCNPDGFSRIYSSVNDCVDTTNRFLNCDALQEGDVCFAHPENYNAAQAGACTRQTGAAACDDKSTPAACDKVCDAG